MSGTAPAPVPPAAAPADRDPQAPACEYTWGEGGLCVVIAGADVAGAEQAADALSQAAWERLAGAAAAARDLDGARQAARLAEDLARTEAERNAARTTWTESETIGRDLLSRGEDPAKAERVASLAQNQHRILEARTSYLSGLLARARTDARAAQVTALERCWKDLLEEALGRRLALLHRIGQGLQGPLSELLAADSAISGLYDGITGGVPAQALALLDLPPAQAPLAGGG